MGNNNCSSPQIAAKEEPVHLNVYDLGTSWRGKALNHLLRPLGLGAFHCGVEIFGVEWSFSVDPKDVGGIFQCEPKKCPGHSFYTTVEMGTTSTSLSGLIDIIEFAKKDWRSDEYHLLQRNCCHFCSELCTKLGVGEVPLWVMSLPNESARCLEPECCGDAEVDCWAYQEPNAEELLERGTDDERLQHAIRAGL